MFGKRQAPPEVVPVPVVEAPEPDGMEDVSYRGYLLRPGMPSRFNGDVGIFFKGAMITTARSKAKARTIVDGWLDAP